jgi:hypothetical protein
MKHRDEHEEKHLSPEGFSMPGNYFGTSATVLQNRLLWLEEHRLYPELSRLRNGKGFTVPEGYFHKAPEVFIERPPEERSENGGDEQELPDQLVALKKQQPFRVPDQYFSESALRIHQRTVKTRRGIYSLFQIPLSHAMAAMLMIVVGLWIYSLSLAPPPEEDCGTIACLDRSDLVKTGQLEGLEDDQLYELVDPAALERKLSMGLSVTAWPPEEDTLPADELQEDDILEDI